jgi:anti-anti-sigma factor
MMPRKVRETYHKIGELLVRRNLAPPEVIDEALAAQRAALERRRNAPRLGDILVERKILDRATIREILEEQRIGRGEKRVLRLDLRDADGVAIVVLDGRLDGSKLDAVTRVFERLMNRGFARIALDCTRLVFLDSSGVSGLLAYVDEARARGGDMKFFGLTPDARFVLQRLGLTAFIQTFTREDETLKAFELPIDEYMSRGALAEYISAANTRYFHLSYCALAQKLSEDNRIYYESKWHARGAGKTPCKRCKP